MFIYSCTVSFPNKSIVYYLIYAILFLFIFEKKNSIQGHHLMTVTNFGIVNQYVYDYVEICCCGLPHSATILEVLFHSQWTQERRNISFGYYCIINKNPFCYFYVPLKKDRFLILMYYVFFSANYIISKPTMAWKFFLKKNQLIIRLSWK